MDSFGTFAGPARLAEFRVLGAAVKGEVVAGWFCAPFDRLGSDA
jgi:hypothetical protein